MTDTSGVCSVHLDFYPYDGEDDEPMAALWVVVTSRGPAVGALAGRFGAMDRGEMLILESDDLFSESKIDAMLVQLDRTRTFRLSMRVLSFHSDLGEGNGWTDIVGDSVDVTLCRDEFDQLTAEAPLTDGWAEFGSRAIASRLSETRSVSHEDWRLLHLLCGVSRSLRDHLETELNRTRVDMLPPAVASKASRHWVPVSKDGLADRITILRALLRPNSVFTRKQIGIILAGEAKWSMDDNGNFERVEAKRETVAGLIVGAGIKPKHSNRFSALDITQRLIPFAVTRRSWGLRYEELREELRELGIFVPDDAIANRTRKENVQIVQAARPAV